jgi:hypothetical protein
LQDKTVALNNISNDIGLIGSTTDIRLVQLQISEWLSTSPLQNWPHSDPSPFKDWIPALLSALKSFDLNFLSHPLFDDTVKGGAMPIHSKFTQMAYRKIISMIRPKNLMYCEQLISANGMAFFTYTDTKFLIIAELHSVLPNSIQDLNVAIIWILLLE